MKTVDISAQHIAQGVGPGLESRLRPGALIIADNADESPDYLTHVRSPANGYLSVPFADDVELSMRMALPR